MKLYRLSLIMREPNEDTEGKYLAEAPALPGCRAWGDTAAQALENLQSVAKAFIESYRSRVVPESYRAKGDPLPPEVEASASGPVNPLVLSEVLVAA